MRVAGRESAATSVRVPPGVCAADCTHTSRAPLAKRAAQSPSLRKCVTVSPASRG
jgi:hypothetical protein